MSEFKLPDVGEGLTEAEIVTWHVAVGDEITVNQTIVDIETAKSVVELPSPYAGTVSAIHVEEGATVPVGTPIISIGAQSEDGAERVEPALEPTPAAQSEPGSAGAGRQSVLVGYGPRADSSRRRRRRTSGQAQAADAQLEASSVAPESPEGTPGPPRPLRALAKPPVRKLAKDHGIDLTEVPCDGPVVSRADVEAFIAARDGVDTAGPPGAQRGARGPAEMGTETRIPVKGVRKVTAQAMVSSAFTAPHVTEWVTLDVSATMALVERLKASREFRDPSAGSGQRVKVSPTLVVARAVCLALRRTPELNATWDEAAQEIVVKRDVNLGIAAATERGLVVPNIPAAQSLSLRDLALALADLTETARAGRTQPAQMAGGSFTITNIGVFGVDGGTPILNPGESGILAVGAIERRPWVDEHDAVVPRWVTTLALSFDHRVVDGEQGSRFLSDVAAILRDPAMALTF
ncbi:dihydrolipoamide acetyltransferase family protein [Aeromicrobium sp. CTD01-1L150]|uniref:dihydrolipoamide acetyltransferase family protein n=1 Tax=Aeromicrobium sp. CTD01-1L150 TaxID=3341830 RepID=UPI0035BF585D